MSSPLPSLPGYKPRGPKLAIRLKPPRDDPSIDIINNLSKTQYRSPSKVSDEEATVLSFQAYFIEHVAESERPRMCQINYFVATNEMNVVLKPQVNSLLTAGTYIFKDIYYHPEGRPYLPGDFDFDKEIILNDVTFFIVSCDADTRDYLRQNVYVKSPEKIMSSKEISTTDIDDWGKFHSKKNENKKFIEAQLGNSVDNTNREGFLRFGTNSLKFRLRKHNPSVDEVVLDFSLVYHLADDTVGNLLNIIHSYADCFLEIFALGDYNGNRNGFSKLLRRSKLPKTLEPLSINRDLPQPEFYHWTEFSIGKVLQVYNREMRIVDADTYTRSVYEEVDCPLDPAEKIEETHQAEIPREIPPPIGFGSEEDSLRSCVGSLRIAPPRVKTFGENKSIHFRAKLVTSDPDDAIRDFVFSYFFLDDTAKITEPPKRNSGFIGGVYLSRRKITLIDGTDLRSDHFYIGATIQLPHVAFRLIDTDNRTLQVMEQMGHPMMSLAKIMAKIREPLRAFAENGSLTERFRRVEGQHPGVATMDVVRSALSSFGLIADEPSKLTDQEVLTIMRAYRADTFPEGIRYEHFIEAIRGAVERSEQNEPFLLTAE